ncbi:ABC transporter permease [Halobacillus campisalis]|uniref:ABC transporter permease n=1 Tax=Halobacillus campisalis TaxID=435909 RepID=A0ABW2K0Z0_9BACI|nr:FtsX-like permease family protein [Halobacillus campisalis]
MSINQLIFRNLKKNLKNYYLYVFALTFSVALYFSFVTLQYDPSMDEATGSIRGAAAVRAASILLVAIVAIFLFYANNLFIKRRSQEIGLFQLIGMTKNRIFSILSIENLMIYFGSLLLGTLLGFSISKLVTMTLFKIMEVDDVATLSFSFPAFLQTILVFAAIYAVIMLMNYWFIKRQSILSLFQVKSKTEGRVKNISVLEILMGILGIGLIATGYYVSSKLFEGDFTSMNTLFMVMIFILASVIIGTYFFYKGSVRFVANLIRKNKSGYLNINEVLSLSSIMFRMKSNAMLLTIITTISALAIGLLSLSYISYYSAEKTAEASTPADFTVVTEEAADELGQIFSENGIEYSEERIEVVIAEADITNIVGANLQEISLNDGITDIAFISEKAADMDIQETETLLTGYNDALQQLMSLEDSGDIVIHTANEKLEQQYIGLAEEDLLPIYFTGGFPTAVVDEKTFDIISNDIDEDIQRDSSLYIGLQLEEGENRAEADELFQNLAISEEYGNDSQYATERTQKQNMGLVMFIVGFLGLAFLITSGCVLYFKQMEESEEEQPNYTILRKLGYTRHDLLKGIQGKQVFNFGIPLLIGLLHSYFAVQSGWFFFGTELWTPMLLVMGVYTGLYSIFGLLSVLYYKKVIRESL